MLENDVLLYDDQETDEEGTIETIQIIDVEPVSTFDIETDDAFAALGDPNEQLQHSLLNSRDLPDQHPITAITGLRKELDQIEALKEVQSNHIGVANYYEWSDGGREEHGYFVSLLPHSSMIKICEGSDIFGVTVENAGFIGGQDGITIDYVDGFAETYGAARDHSYGLVATSGLVDVRCELDVDEGDYVISNWRGMAEKTSTACGYKVIAVNEKHGTRYASISLGVQACTTDLLSKEIYALDERMDAAETNIVSAINVANAAYNKATDTDAYNQIISDKVDGALETVDRVTADVDDMEIQVQNSNVIAAQARAIAEGAAVTAETLRQEAVDEANKALDETSKLRDEFQQKAEELGNSVGSATEDLAALRTDLEPLATWPAILDVFTWEGEDSASKDAIYYCEQDKVYYYYSDKWNSTAVFSSTGANTKKIYRVIELGLYWYYKSGTWRSTTDLMSTGISTYAGYIAQASEDAAILSTMVGRKGRTGESLAGFIQNATNTNAVVQGIASYEQKDADGNVIGTNVAGLIAQVEANKSSLELIVKGEEGVAGLKAQVDANTAELDMIAEHEYGGKKGLAAINQQVTDQGASIDSLTSWEDESRIAMARIEQKADENGAYIQSTVANMDKYTVGPYSQSSGFTVEQAKNVLEKGMIYVPTVTHIEEEPFNREFTRTYHCTWDGEKWVSSDAPTVTFSSEYDTGNDNNPYWFIEGENDVVTENGKVYIANTLQKWEKSRWVQVATLAGNSSNRAVSQIRQDANSIEQRVTNVEGAYAGIKTTVDSDHSKVNSIASWPTDGGKHNMAILEQKSDASGSYMVLAAVTDVNGEPEITELGGAKIVLNDSNDGSYIKMDADQINFGNNVTITNTGNDVMNVADNFIVDRSGNVRLNGNITWGTDNSPTQVVYCATGDTKPVDGTKWSEFPATSTTGWHRTWSDTTDYFASYTYDGGTTWTSAVRVKSESGSSVEISSDGYWIIDGVKTNTKAEGQDGQDGQDGDDGSTPYIQNGYWYINGSNTGVKAKGEDGTDGSDATVDYTSVFNALTNNGSKKGIFDGTSGELYINANYINSGIITADYLNIDNIEATGVDISGAITATEGTIGGCTISDGVLQITNANIAETLTSDKINVNGLTATGVDITGKITATEGTIGGCAISSDGKLQVAEANISGTLTSKVLNINNVKATGVDITGKITATEGIIGGTNGWKIGSGSISSSNSTCSFTLNSTGTSPWLLVQQGTQTKVVITPDGSMSVQGMQATDLSASNINITSGNIKIGSNFNVSNTGVVTANGGKFDSGTFTNITASSGTIGSWTIDGGLKSMSTSSYVTIGPNELIASRDQGVSSLSSTWYDVARAGTLVSQGKKCDVVANVYNSSTGKEQRSLLSFVGGILTTVEAI